MKRLTSTVCILAALAVAAPVAQATATLSKARAQAAMLVALQSPEVEEAMLSRCHRLSPIRWGCIAHVVYEGNGGGFTIGMTATRHSGGRVTATTV